MAAVISFGAAGEVTGSLHLVELNGLRLVVDCGLFQGEREERNREAFAFDPGRVDYLILTHAHLDHIGRVPLLYKHGFDGTLVATRPTYKISREMLTDSARVMQADCRTGIRVQPEAPEPVYDIRDVERVFRMPVTLLPYHATRELAPGVTVTFRRAGHILGSSIVELTIEEAGRRKRLVFSGDIGRPRRLLIPGLEQLREADSLFVESTYGDRALGSLEQAVSELEAVIAETLDRGGVVMIPAFALGRTQEIISLLAGMHARGLLSANVYVDAPLGIRLTELYTRFGSEFRDDVRGKLLSGNGPFRFPGLKMLRSPAESMALNRLSGPAVIIAGAGMCNGGRIGHHFRFHAGDPDNSIVFVGYQVPGTKGRQILDGEQLVQFQGQDVRFRARVLYISGLTAHGDCNDLTAWIEGFGRLEQVHLVHGEPAALEAMKARIGDRTGIRAHIVAPGERIDV